MTYGAGGNSRRKYQHQIKCRKPFDFAAKRRREIVLHARHVGAAETEDFPCWLIAWVWHNPKAKDQIWSVMNAARIMGCEITEAEASAITEEASIIRQQRSADNLAKFLGVTYAQRQALGLTTIGSVNVRKRARKEMRKRSDRLAKEAKRRAAGMRPQSESLSRTKPWEAMKMSRRTWYRQRTKGVLGRSGTVSSAAIFLSSDDEVVPTARLRRKKNPSGASPRKKKAAIRLATATTMVADRYGALPMELRLAALCLPIPENPTRAKIGVAA
jgi:hypothetical protein